MALFRLPDIRNAQEWLIRQPLAMERPIVGPRRTFAVKACKYTSYFTNIRRFNEKDAYMHVFSPINRISGSCLEFTCTFAGI
ncbi:hypothetical protein [Cohnella sp. GCM10012308]|uniref:hypothetical protein n=1 Tax=Cohnella sp. GCM10012308 TaxID=3317329 RepID=UPI003620F6FD